MATAVLRGGDRGFCFLFFLIEINSSALQLNTGGKSTSTMQQVNLQVGTEAECKERWGNGYNHEKQICNVTPNKSVCSVRILFGLGFGCLFVFFYSTLHLCCRSVLG